MNELYQRIRRWVLGLELVEVEQIMVSNPSLDWLFDWVSIDYIWKLIADRNHGLNWIINDDLLLLKASFEGWGEDKKKLAFGRTNSSIRARLSYLREVGHISKMRFLDGHKFYITLSDRLRAQDPISRKVMVEVKKNV